MLNTDNQKNGELKGLTNEVSDTSKKEIIHDGVLIEDTFAEALDAWIASIVITASKRDLAETAAISAIGYGTSIIGCGAEAGIADYVIPQLSPDGRPGVTILLVHPDKKQLKEQVIDRIAECILTAPTTAVFNGLPKAPERIPIKIHYFGDGFEYQTNVRDRNVWAIPIMGGEFLIEEEIGIVKGVAGGNFFVMGNSQMAALTAAQAAVEAILSLDETICSFPGGVVSSGSKVGSLKYKFMKATTNHLFCPTLKDTLPDSLVPEGVRAIYEIVIDGTSYGIVKQAIHDGIHAACSIDGIIKISAGNYGGKLGPHKFYLRDSV